MAITFQAVKESAQYYLVPSIEKKNVFKGQIAVTTALLGLCAMGLKRSVASSFANRSLKALFVLAAAYAVTIGIRAAMQLRGPKDDAAVLTPPPASDSAPTTI
jgi:hypothetical protein